MRNRSCGCDCDKDITNLKAIHEWERVVQFDENPIAMVRAGRRLAELLSEANLTIARLQNEPENDLDDVMGEADEIVRMGNEIAELRKVNESQSNHTAYIIHGNNEYRRQLAAALQKINELKDSTQLANHYEERFSQLLADIEVWRDRNEELNIKVKALQAYSDDITKREGKPDQSYVVPKTFNGHNLPELVEDINDRFRDLQDVILVMNTLMAGGSVAGASGAAPTFTPEEIDITRNVITANFRNIKEQMASAVSDARDTHSGRIHPRAEFIPKGTAVRATDDEELDSSGRIPEGQDYNLKKNGEPRWSSSKVTED